MSQLRFIFVFCLMIIQYAETFIRYIVSYYATYLYVYIRLIINPPGRPIVSGIGTLTEYVSAFVDRELQPLLANIPSYIKDTTDFLNKLSRFNNLPDNTILVTLDGTAVYSNIPHNDGIGDCKKHLDRRALSTTSSEDI